MTHITRSLRAGVLPAVSYSVLLAACGSSTPRAPQPDPTVPQSGPSSSSQTYVVSGVVSDDQGVPLSNATVILDHGDKLPDLNSSTIRVVTATRSDGSYEIALKADQVQAGYDPFAIIRAFTRSQDYTQNTQVLDRQGVGQVKNLRLRRVREISAGQAIAIAIESDSSLCVVGVISVTRVCESFRIRYPGPGLLTVAARPDAGSIVPTVRNWIDSAQGTLSTSVNTEDFDSVSIIIEMPAGTAPQRYDVLTTLQ